MNEEVLQKETPKSLLMRKSWGNLEQRNSEEKRSRKEKNVNRERGKRREERETMRKGKEEN